MNLFLRVVGTGGHAPFGVGAAVADAGDYYARALRDRLAPAVLVRTAEYAARHLAQEIFQARGTRLIVVAHHPIEDQLGMGRAPDILPAVPQFGDDVEGCTEGAKQLRRQSRFLIESLEAERA